MISLNQVLASLLVKTSNSTASYRYEELHQNEIKIIEKDGLQFLYRRDMSNSKVAVECMCNRGRY